MNEPFAWDPVAIAAALRDRGYDVDDRAAHLGAGGSLAARRDRSERAVLVVVDAGGRFKAEATTIGSDASHLVEIGGVGAHLVETVQTVTTLTAVLPGAAALASLLDAVDRLGGSRSGPGSSLTDPRSTDRLYSARRRPG